MKPAEITYLRLSSQQLVGPKFTSPADLVGWMGAMQAQDYPMARWAIAVRLPICTDADVLSAIDRGEIIRTHLLRPTWHFATAEDVTWLLDLSADHIKASQRYRDRDLELTEKVYSKSNTIIEKVLSGGGHLTRNELVYTLQKANIATDQNRASHLFMRAELEQIICSGENRGGKPTYTLLSQRAPRKKKYSKEEALAELARRYFTSRGYASIQDFTWWSGLPAGEARQALELIRDELHTEGEGRDTFWMPIDADIRKHVKKTAHILPVYDELIISYANRSAFTPGSTAEKMRKVSANAIFTNIIEINGQIAGGWKRKVKREVLEMEMQLIRRLWAAEKSLLNEAAERFGNFNGKRIGAILWNQVDE